MLHVNGGEAKVCFLVPVKKDFSFSGTDVYFDGVSSSDQVLLIGIEASLYVANKVFSGIETFLLGQGVELLNGTVTPLYRSGGLSFTGASFTYSWHRSHTRRRRQIFIGYFKRVDRYCLNTAAKSHGKFTKRLEKLLRRKMNEYEKSYYADWKGWVCSDDLVAIRCLEPISLAANRDKFPLFANEWPLTHVEASNFDRIKLQPLQGFGYRPRVQLARPRRYRLVIIGTRQAGLCSHVLMLLCMCHMRVVSATLCTKKGRICENTYIIETFSKSGVTELLRRFSQYDKLPLLVGPSRQGGLNKLPGGQNWFLPLYDPQVHRGLSGHGAAWFGDGTAYVGEWKDGYRESFGRWFGCSDKVSPGRLIEVAFEGDWRKGMPDGWGCRLDNGNKYLFGKFSEGEIVRGISICPFEPPSNSKRIPSENVSSQGSAYSCVYKHHMIRSDQFRKRLPLHLRCLPALPVRRLVGKKYGDERPLDLQSLWLSFSESPVPLPTLLDFCEMAALLDLVHLEHAAEAAFSKRVSGALVEAMNVEEMMTILNLTSLGQVCMVCTLFRTLTKAHNIDRYMRHPLAISDVTLNPCLADKCVTMSSDSGVTVLDGKVGEGSYGKVLLAQYRRVANINDFYEMEEKNNQPPQRSESVSCYLALKEPIGGKQKTENASEVAREFSVLNALSAIKHPNIVSLQGIMADPSRPSFENVYLATVLADLCLPTLIYGNSKGIQLNAKTLFRLSHDVANGLAYIHQVHMIHGDIKSPNVLLCHQRGFSVAKICDFGHAGVRSGPRTQKRMCTFGWASPESVRDHETCQASDIWSFGVLMWEMAVREVPWCSCGHPYICVAVGYCGLSPESHKGKSVEKPQHTPSLQGVALVQRTQFSQLLRKCCQFEPKERLKACEAAREIRRIIKFSRRNLQKDLGKFLSG